MTPRARGQVDGLALVTANHRIFTLTPQLNHMIGCTYSIVLTSSLISFMYKTRRCGGITHDNHSEEKKNVFRYIRQVASCKFVSREIVSLA